jgi:hypothetical protein
VNYNLSNLSEKIKWAHENQHIASAIADHAAQTVKTLLRKEDLQCYVYRLLLEYQELFENC